MADLDVVHPLNQFGLKDKVDQIFLSHRMGLAKPNTEIFIRVANELGVVPGDIVFFDDNLANIASANTLGYHAHLVNGPDDIKRVLSA